MAHLVHFSVISIYLFFVKVHSLVQKFLQWQKFCLQFTMWSFYFFIFVIIINLLPSSSSAEELRLEEFKPRRSQTVGKKFSLFCAVQEGTGPLFYKWTKDGHLLSPNGANHQVKSTEDNSVLTINQLSPSDAGNYSCSVSNNAGQSDHQTTMLIVKGFYFPFFYFA